MALAKGHINLVQSCVMGGDLSSSSLGSSSSANSNEFLFQPTSHQTEEAKSLINFKDSFLNLNGSLLSFQQNVKTSDKDDHYLAWDQDNWNVINNHNNNYLMNIHPRRLLENFNCVQTATNFGSITETDKQNHGDWLYAEATVITDKFQDPAAAATLDACFHKRPKMEESMQAVKKQSNSATKKPKQKSAPSKEPQSIAAKNRRERISERLKTLQELVPNGSKVDLVTMLEKAISYVKFLQLQVKVLATDEFWPAQGGKAPDINQVKEAIDAMISSQRDRSNSSSSSK